MSGLPIETVLVANRGEIAVRVIDACHRLGLRAVAVYSDADRDAPHTARADAAMRLGPAPARDSYLNVDALLDAAGRAGADAVHPGYGFLSENAGFARACGEAGLVYIGPRPEAIEVMGAKSAAKAIAAEAGVPTVPGYHGEAQDDATLFDEARCIGWPLLIKASAGGGGRGMRRVDTADGFIDALAQARAEAEGAFGDSTLLLERFVPRARHLEVQVLGDRHGNRVHFYERDCSLQRKHQKLIEEAPAPSLPGELRRDLWRRALDLAKAIDYDSAGTVEFVYDAASEQAWFLEMNTRLQVEHPVTEAVTGVDLVAWQIRIAAGEALDFGQGDVGCAGWAMEARVAAEDPAADYAPCTGTLSHWRAPRGPGLRVDSGVEAGTRIGHHYDSLLAKVIAHGRDRNEARGRLRAALGGLEAAGVGLNTGFLRDLLDLPEFIAGRHHTALITDRWPAGWTPPPLDPRCLIDAALAAQLAPGDHGGAASPWIALGAWRVTEGAGRPGTATHHVRREDGSMHTVSLAGRHDRLTATLDNGEPLAIRSATLHAGRLVYDSGDQRCEVRVVFDEDRITLLRPEGAVTLVVLPPEAALLGRTTAESAEGGVVAPMPGAVVEVAVAAGQAVRAGEPLCVLEAMKMFQTLTAPFDGIVAELRCAAGDNVPGGALLAVVAPLSESTPENDQ